MWEEGYVCKRTGAIGGQKRLPEPPLDSEILAVVVSHMGAGNQTQFICKRSVSPALSFFFFLFELVLLVLKIKFRALCAACSLPQLFPQPIDS